MPKELPIHRLDTPRLQRKQEIFIMVQTNDTERALRFIILDKQNRIAVSGKSWKFVHTGCGQSSDKIGFC
jgi:hypothetical protein